MLFLKILFFTGILIVFYSYLGYGLVIWSLIRIRMIFRRRDNLADVANYPDGANAAVANAATSSENIFAPDLPAVTLIVAAYNEEGFIEQKIKNSLTLEYPADKLDILFITDGSTDATPDLVAGAAGIRALHEPERKGKIAAIHRAMAYVRTPVVIFSDANTLLNKESVHRIAMHYRHADTGGVAGEKKVLMNDKGKIAGVGEGLYWKYESLLKRLDARLYTVVGAAGELFSIRTDLYEYVGDNVLLDDFVISLGICRKGYRIQYEPGAFALEAPSASLRDEQKRKIRISAGAFQSMVILKDLLNFFKYPMLSFQYISHRVLRWTLCPLLLPLLLVLNVVIVLAPSNGDGGVDARAGDAHGGAAFYWLILACQTVFYLAAVVGWLFAKKNIKVKLLYVPYYFLFLNISLYQGFARYLRGQQSVLWEKAAREKNIA
jgi:biofilm PGA synthesis N-glycosyltransferase PgaC